MHRYIDVDALLKQIEIDSDGEPGAYGDMWEFFDTIKKMPVVTINDPVSENKVTNCNHNADDSKKVSISWGQKNGLIDREQAIDAMARRCDFHEKDKMIAIATLQCMPSAQPETHDKRTETHACENTCDFERKSNDMISRQDAIEALDCINGVAEVLKSLPSTQPEVTKYEYHYDHTDCIWYRPEARNRCPTTCAQYRDGWNDAMNYIFRDGKGYRPYRRDKQYEE